MFDFCNAYVYNMVTLPNYLTTCLKLRNKLTMSRTENTEKEKYNKGKSSIYAC